MKQVLIRQGHAVVEDVPAPALEAGTVLVRVGRSCVSVGTEMSGLASSGMPLWKRALAQPHNVKKALDTMAALGPRRTWSLIQGQLAAGNPTGYSAAGEVIAVGAGITDLAVGDRVACAGAQCANHAEIIRVPRNLTVPVPDPVSIGAASTVTLGAIALQGVRRAAPTLGENVVVVGLGILGQITAQLLKANGCRVIGVDLDRRRLEIAVRSGMDVALDPDETIAADQVARLTDGIGADAVIITAASKSNDVVQQAFRMSRRKGRVVLVGDVGLALDRADIYQKELDFLVSTSYGPGRYDSRYEDLGLDYPVAYVRWTENRNMAEYLRLIADRRLVIDDFIATTFTVENAGEAYASLQSGSDRPLTVLLTYPETAGTPAARIRNLSATPAKDGTLGLAIVGAGGFAKGMHLPNLSGMKRDFALRAIVDRSGPNAVATARQWGAGYATADLDEVLHDTTVDAVLIATPHNLHADMVLAALSAGKHVLVEKPLALTASELQRIEAFYADGAGTPMLLTGFNRRFSRYAVAMREWLSGRSGPMILNYRMNAGFIPADHWTQTDVGGGRNRGEACHIYDLFTALTGSRVVSVSAHAIRPSGGHYGRTDNFVATLVFDDGSVASLTYTALGAREYPKERLEVFADGKVIALDDYRSLEIVGARKPKITTSMPEKGQREELLAFAAGLRAGTWPIPLWQQIQATQIALDVDAQLERGA
jgi:predicted dehydrogenase